MESKGLKLIGKGLFTKCYRLNEKTVLLKSSDPVKECMSLGWFPEHPLFPVVEATDLRNHYTMEYYPRTKGLKKYLDPDQYQLYTTLRTFFNRVAVGINGNYLKLYSAIELYLEGDIQELLKEAIDACSNYRSDICFEISPRNVAVKNGKLILLDCFFFKSEVVKVSNF